MPDGNPEDVKFISQNKALTDIESTIKTGSCINALDKETSNFINSHLIAELPKFSNKFQGANYDDIPITLFDNLELGDEVIAIEKERGISGFSYYKTVKFE